MRGKLIWPFKVELYRLDQVATDADPDAAGPLTSGFDDDFRETIVRDVSGTRTSGRKELAPILVPAQIEPEILDQIRAASAGVELDGFVNLVMHYADLERLDLVEPGSGKPKIIVNDRFSRILNYRTEALVEDLSPGLFVQGVMSTSFGLSGGERNLVIVQCRNREKTAP